MNEPWFGILLIVAGLALFVSVQINFVGLVRASGRLARWAMLVPPTRVGLSAVAAFLATLGVQIIRYALGQNGGRNAITTFMVLLLIGGLLHDLVAWALSTHKSRRNGL
jgi:hypothetical protein